MITTYKTKKKHNRSSRIFCSISGMYHHTNGLNILAKDMNMFKGDEITTEAYTVTAPNTSYWNAVSTTVSPSFLKNTTGLVHASL